MYEDNAGFDPKNALEAENPNATNNNYYSKLTNKRK